MEQQTSESPASLGIGNTRRALVSVANKTGLPSLVRGLAQRGFQLVSTGGTADKIEELKLPVTRVAEVTGFPEIMDGRVKTLHPNIHGGILARRHNPRDMETIKQHGIAPIDLVVVNLYEFAQAADRAVRGELDFDGLVEEIDVGGPTMVRAAAKNFRDVLVVVNPERYDDLLKQLDQEGGTTLEFRFELAKEAFAHTAAYDTMIAATLAKYAVEVGDIQGPF
jgi:phosphoribosylaminoimidazolecarboxamide formyltransferase/IMP cyclohydrolase